MRAAVIGSGPAGMTAAMLLARQGHDVTLVDRDHGPTDGAPWKRVGVMQFHLPHAFRPQCRTLLQERLPDVYDALVAAGVEDHGDLLRARRSTFESALWRHTSREPGVRRVAGRAERVHVFAGEAHGVVVGGVGLVDADLVIDASGRRASPSDPHRPIGSSNDTAIAYSSRLYELLPGAAPGPFTGGPGIMHELDGMFALLFIHDARTFTVLFVRDRDDHELAALRDPTAFDAATRLLPDIAEWVDPSRSRPLEQIRSGTGIFNAYRPQSTTVPNLLAIGDAVCTTNPMGARGVALGMASAAAAVDIVGGTPRADWAGELDRWCHDHQKTWHDDHVVTDEAVSAAWRGDALRADGPVAWPLIVAAAQDRHPEWMAALGPFFGMQAPPASLDPLRDEVREMLRAGWRPPATPGPNRRDVAEAIEQEIRVARDGRHVVGWRDQGKEVVQS